MAVCWGSVSESISIALCWITSVWLCRVHEYWQSSGAVHAADWLRASCCLTHPGSLTHSFFLRAQGWRKGGIGERKWRVEGWNEKMGGRGLGEREKGMDRMGKEVGLGFRKVICLAACAQPPPQWHNRTMYCKCFKYLYCDLMFL